MLTVSDEQFAAIMGEVMDELPKDHMRAVKNVAIVYDDEPTPQQLARLRLQCNQTLSGLYEGVPLTLRAGQTGFPPDKITIFKGPLVRHVNDLASLRAEIKHTLWHEIAHYFGLDHNQIHALERRPPS